jgi:hypothetical protein
MKLIDSALTREGTMDSSVWSQEMIKEPSRNHDVFVTD